MNLQEISRAIGVNIRTLRYLMEQDLVPGLRRESPGRGIRRVLNTEEARMLAFAAILHELGFRGSAARSLAAAARPRLKKQESTIVVSSCHRHGDFYQTYKFELPLGQRFYKVLP